MFSIEMKEFSSCILFQVLKNANKNYIRDNLDKILVQVNKNNIENQKFKN